MENGLKALYMGFSTLVFVMGITMLIILQRVFDNTYRGLMEVVNGGYIW